MEKTRSTTTALSTLSQTDPLGRGCNTAFGGWACIYLVLLTELFKYFFSSSSVLPPLVLLNSKLNWLSQELRSAPYLGRRVRVL